jgi:hypothetical protein
LRFAAKKSTAASSSEMAVRDEVLAASYGSSSSPSRGFASAGADSLSHRRNAKACVKGMRGGLRPIFTDLKASLLLDFDSDVTRPANIQDHALFREGLALGICQS